MHDLIAPSFNFFVVIGLLVYFLRKPFKQMLADRHGQVQKQVEDAAIEKKTAQEKLLQFSEKLSSFEREAAGVLDRARGEADVLKQKIVADAQATAARILKDAEATAEANAADLRDKITRETIAQAMAMTEKMLTQNFSGDDQKRLVDEFLAGVQK